MSIDYPFSEIEIELKIPSRMTDGFLNPKIPNKKR